MNPTESDQTDFVAWAISGWREMPINPAPISREWMDQTQERFAYRCLPLTIANQSGWVIGSPCSFTARWNGGPTPDDTVVVCDIVPPDKKVSTIFGHGVVTFNMPCLFRTPPGINLWVKGLTNAPKDGIHALEGIVETDWTAATFTMNWKFTRPDHMVRFERGEPICMVVPFPRDFLDSLNPRECLLSTNPELLNAFQEWSKSRDKFHELVAAHDPEAERIGWQKHYFQGRDPGSDRFSQHQTRLAIKPFTSELDRS